MPVRFNYTTKEERERRRRELYERKHGRPTVRVPPAERTNRGGPEHWAPLVASDPKAPAVAWGGRDPQDGALWLAVDFTSLDILP